MRFNGEEKPSFTLQRDAGSKDTIGQFRWCPTMDLIAVVTADTQVTLSISLSLSAVAGAILARAVKAQQKTLQDD
jgi:hypothetical protein